MGKGQLQRRSIFGQQPGCDRRIHLVPRIRQPGNRHDRRDRRVLPPAPKLPPGKTELPPGAPPPGPGSPRTAPAAPATREPPPHSAGQRRSPPATPGNTARCLQYGPPVETPRAATALPTPSRRPARPDRPGSAHPDGYESPANHRPQTAPNRDQPGRRPASTRPPAPCPHAADARQTAPHVLTAGQPSGDRQWRARRPDRRIATGRTDPAAELQPPAG